MMGMMPIPLSTRVTWETTTLELVCEEKQVEVTGYAPTLSSQRVDESLGRLVVVHLV